MSTTEGQLAKLEGWFDQQNARHDAIASSRPTWWVIGKILFGLLFIAKAMIATWLADSLGCYALALLLLSCGAALAYEGGVTLAGRWRGD